MTSSSTNIRKPAEKGLQNSLNFNGRITKHNPVSDQCRTLKVYGMKPSNINPQKGLNLPSNKSPFKNRSGLEQLSERTSFTCGIKAKVACAAVIQKDIRTYVSVTNSSVKSMLDAKKSLTYS